MKKIISIVAMLVVALVLPLIIQGTAATTPVTATSLTVRGVYVESVPVHFPDQRPVVVAGRTLVPIRPVFEHLGFEVLWFSATNQAVLTRGYDVITITLHSRYFTTNDVIHELDVYARTINGRTVVPLRAPLESIGYTLGWCSYTHTITITSPAYYYGEEESEYPVEEEPASYGEIELFHMINAERARIGVEDMCWAVFRAKYVYKREKFNLVNAERARMGLHEFIWCNILTVSGHMHSRDMAVNNFAGHIGSDGANGDQRTHRLPGGHIYVGALGNGTDASNPYGAFRVLMGSPLHSAWLLIDEAHFTHAGPGFYHYEAKYYEGGTRFEVIRARLEARRTRFYFKLGIRHEAYR